ncbi:MAG: ATP synthase F0 subunit B [Holophagaceae bacterium]|nr:ATP synthase F0 subunit B [Holophagaceae bacterium]
MVFSLTSTALLAGGSILDSLPDPMTPTLVEIGFVMGLLVFLYFFLKMAFFRPLTKLMDDREAEIQAGSSVKLEASKTIESRQADYTEKLKELRAKAFEHRKALAQVATEEKSRLIEKARHDAETVRKEAIEKLALQRETAKSELIAQVDALAEGMVQHLLKQA